ncbi:transporter, LysE family [Rhodoferax antarcticus ANT.BR]|uniref:Transporter, LysE family n=1 Tax=Rhodoferax antarcticus ANT.BR TaxID=1111071 RepID=A0A1Q8YCA5_9BURK|nr:transporter, LysE family [Rhodoferax antarcticus ANT.BR]
MRVLLTLGGAIYMLNLAYRIARADMTDAFTETITKAPSVFSGVLAQVSNPKAWIVSIAAVSIYVNSSDYYNFTLILFCVVFFFACSLSLLGWSAIGATARKNFGNLRRFNVIMAILLTTSIALMLKDILSEFKHFFEYT